MWNFLISRILKRTFIAMTSEQCYNTIIWTHTVNWHYLKTRVVKQLVESNYLSQLNSSCQVLQLSERQGHFSDLKMGSWCDYSDDFEVSTEADEAFFDADFPKVRHTIHKYGEENPKDIPDICFCFFKYWHCVYRYLYQNFQLLNFSMAYLS